MNDKLRTVFPGLTDDNHIVTSPSSNRYNCIAWAAGDSERWWWPADQNFWPVSALRTETVQAIKSAFSTLGYTPCEDGRFAKGYEKIAIFAKQDGSRLVPTHAAKQLPNGRWTSKLGRDRDIEHENIDDLISEAYGEPVSFMHRRRRPKRSR